jgi:hypothetical protein
MAARPMPPPAVSGTALPTPDAQRDIDAILQQAVSVSDLKHFDPSAMLPIDLQQMKDGYTVRVLREFADAQHVVLAYQVSGPPGKDIIPFGNLIRDGGGPLALEVSVNNPFDPADRMATGTTLQFVAYSLDAREPLPTELNLHLVLNLFDLTTYLPQTPVTPVRPTAAGDLPPITRPFTFDFNVPVQVDTNK